MNAQLTNVFAIVAYIYFFPSIIAYRRKSPNLLAVASFNLFFGWSAMGWLVALLWAQEITLRKLVDYVTSSIYRNPAKPTLKFTSLPATRRDLRKVSVHSGGHATNF